MTESSERRDVILTHAAELFARKGVGATTVRDIADSVGILSGSLYHHFDSKDEIVAEVLRQYLGIIRDEYGQVLAEDLPAIDALRRLIVVSLQIVENHPAPTAIYQNELHHLRELPALADVRQSASEIQGTWLDVIERGVADGSLRGDVPPKVLYRLIRDTVWLSVRWHRPGGDYPTERLADDLTSVFLDGYRARPRPAQSKRSRTTAIP